MNSINIKKLSGVTLVEFVIVTAVLVVVAVILTGAFSSYLEKETLSRETENVASVIESARSKTLASKDAFQYGVHIESDKVVFFKGDTYLASDPDNKPENLHKRISISSINLSGGATDIVFERLTGKTSQDGTIELSVVSDPSASTTITIKKTGIVFVGQ